MKPIILFILLSIPFIGTAQLGVAYHHSSIPFVGINYEFKDRFRPEARIGTNTLFEDISLEAVFTYDILDKEVYEFYAGLGVKTASLGGLVIPIGVNFYPFTKKNFGFHIEISPIFGEEAVLRGSFGIRYRFRQAE